ncbi:MAG: hypothetical protein HYX96_08015 [Chloroflexi bacterium]|nr:hypothetical protein [Chloroflexota bacterium]
MAGKWDKPLFRCLIILCVALVFASGVARHSQSHPGYSTTAIQRPTYAMLPVPVRLSGELHVSKRAQDSLRRDVSPAPEAVLSHSGFTPGPDSVLYADLPDSLLRKAAHQSCSLLDIPPPAV